MVPFKIFSTKSLSGISFPSTFNFKPKLCHLSTAKLKRRVKKFCVDKHGLEEYFAAMGVKAEIKENLTKLRVTHR